MCSYLYFFLHFQPNLKSKVYDGLIFLFNIPAESDEELAAGLTRAEMIANMKFVAKNARIEENESPKNLPTNFPAGLLFQGHAYRFNSMPQRSEKASYKCIAKQHCKPGCPGSLALHEDSVNNARIRTHVDGEEKKFYRVEIRLGHEKKEEMMEMEIDEPTSSSKRTRKF